MLKRSPRGTKDITPDYYEIFDHVRNTAYDLAGLYGFRGVDTPIFEYTELFSKALGDTSDIVSKEMYNFEDRSGNSLTLRPEYTASIVRMFNDAGFWNDTPLRFFSAGPVFRYDRPQKGRYRQFHQINCEILGLLAPEADAELITLASDLLRKFDLLDSLRLEINSLGDKETRNRYREKLLEYLLTYYEDLSPDSKIRVKKNPLRVLDSKDQKDIEIVRDAPKISDSYTKEASVFFERVQMLLHDVNVKYKVNPHLVRGLDYYVHTAFEFISDDLGGAQSTVLGGGRYDGAFILGKSLECVGFASGIERIIELISYTPKESLLLVLAPIGEVAEKHAFTLASKLRNSGVMTLLEYSGNLSKRLKKADKLNAEAVLIFGEDELNEDSYMLRILKNGNQEKISSSNLILRLKEILHG